MVLRQYFKKPLLYISLLIVLVSLFIGAKDRIDWYYQNLSYLSSNIPSDVNIAAARRVVDLFSGYDVFINGIGFANSGFYPILIMLVVGFLFTGKFSQSLSDGSGITEITRIGYKEYHQKEALQNFIATFVFVACTLILFLVICICLYSGTPPTKGHSSAITTITDLYYNTPLLYCLLQIINQALFLALFSLLCMGTVIIYTNTFINRISPLIVYLFLTITSQILYQFTGIHWFVFFFPDIIFVPFNVEGGTVIGFVGEKICAYLLLTASIIVVHCFMYKKYRNNYLK